MNNTSRKRAPLAGISAILLGILFIFMFMTSGTARAVEVGTLSWDEYTPDDCDFLLLCGPVFSVENFSDDPDIFLGSLGMPGESFFDVFIDLEIDSGITSISLGEVPIGESRQSLDDLSGLDILTASLRFTLGDSQLPGIITLRDEFGGLLSSGLTGAGSSALIDYAPPESTPPPTDTATVPEPATILLIVSGVVSIVVMRRLKKLAKLAV